VQTVAIGIFCKTPAAGFSKTRLSPPLRPEDCAVLSACFVRDLAATIDGVAREGAVVPYAVYTPLGSEQQLRTLLPASFRLRAQCDGAFGARLLHAAADLLRAGHAGAILVNADSPTLPASILRAAVSALRCGEDVVVLSPAFDGGYTLIGLSQPHPRLFADIPWSTSQVHRLTVDRAAEIGVPVVAVPGWYDIDDSRTLRLLEAELAGKRPAFAEAAGLVAAPAPATRRFLEQRHAQQPAELSW
jgi:rSAM/selenodomain-associated transferase 1